MHGRPGPEFHALLEVDGPDDHVVAGGQGGHEDVESAALARPGRAGEQRVPAQERHAARLGVLERAEVDRLGDRPGGRPGPADRLGVRVGVQDPQFAPVGLAVAGRVDADRAAVGAERRFDRGYPRGHVGDGLPAGQADPRPPSPQVDARRLELRAGQADRLGDVRPRGEGALHADPGPAAPVRPPRDREDQRADPQSLRERRRERAEERRGREPRARGEHGRRRVDALGEPRQADAARRTSRARTRRGRRRRAGTTTSAGARRGATSLPRGPRPPWWRARSRSGTATPAGR